MRRLFWCFLKIDLLRTKRRWLSYKIDFSSHIITARYRTWNLFTQLLRPSHQFKVSSTYRMIYNVRTIVLSTVSRAVCHAPNQLLFIKGRQNLFTCKQWHLACNKQTTWAKLRNTLSPLTLNKRLDNKREVVWNGALSVRGRREHDVWPRLLSNRNK